MTTKTTTIAFYSAVFLTGLTLVIHLLSFMYPQMVVQISGTQLLHFLAIGMVIPVLHAADQLTTTNSLKEVGTKLNHNIPRWMKALLLLLLLYAIVNFFYTLFGLQGGCKATFDGKEYVLLQQGEIVKNITEAQYFRHQAYSLRIDSAYWVLFFYAEMLVLLGAKKMVTKA